MAINQEYIKQATDEYNPQYNSKVTALKNQLAQNKLALDQQKTGINTNFDTQVSNQNLTNVKSKNNISNTMLGRGLSNSSIVTSGLAEADQQNNRLVGAINTARTGALNDIEAQKALAEQNSNATLTQLEGDRQSSIMSLARQLAQVGWEQNFKNQQLAMEKAAQLAQQAYQNRSLSIQERNAALENSYKLRALALQERNQGSDDAYKNAMLKLEQDKYNDSKNKLSDNAISQLAYLSQIEGDDTLTDKQKASKYSSVSKAWGGIQGYEPVTSKSGSLYNGALERLRNSHNDSTSSSYGIKDYFSNYWGNINNLVGNWVK